jgi:hypothetical protein
MVRRVLGRDRNQRVYVIHAQAAFQDPALPLVGQPAKHFHSQVASIGNDSIPYDLLNIVPYETQTVIEVPISVRALGGQGCIAED